MFEASREVPFIKAATPNQVRTLKGHSGKLQDIKLTQNDQSLVSVAQDGILLVWDVSTGFKTHAIQLSNPWPIALGVSKSGCHIAVGGLDNTVTAYMIDSVEDQYASCSTLDDFSTCVTSPSNAIFNGMYDNNVNSSSRKKIGNFFQSSPTKSHFGTESLQMTGLGNSAPTAVLKGHQGYISSIEYLTEESLISGSGDMSVILWDLTTHTKINEYVDRNLGDVSSLCRHPTNPNIFASASLRTVKVWDKRAKTSLQSFSDHTDDINTVKMFPDGNAIATGSDDSTCRFFDLRSDCQVAIYANPTHHTHYRYTDHNDPYLRSVNNSYSETMALAKDHHTAGRLSNSATTPITPNTPLASKPNGEDQPPDIYAVTAIEFSPSGRLLFCSYADGTWGSWDVLKGKWLGPYSVSGNKYFNLFGGNNGGSNNMVFYGDEMMMLNEPVSGRGQVNAIQVSSDGSKIYTSNWDSIIRVYGT